MEETRRIAEALCRDQRVLLHAQALPNVGTIEANLEAIEETARTHPVAAWKTFTHFPDVFEHDGNAWWLDDHQRGLPAVGEAFIRKARRPRRAHDLRAQGIVVRKSLRVTGRHRAGRSKGPGRTVRRVSLRVRGRDRRGLVHEADRRVGVNRLITSLRKSGVGPNQNVPGRAAPPAMCGAGLHRWNVMRSPTEAAHVLGKLLRYVGEDNVVWGTDCLFYGSPQDQI